MFAGFAIVFVMSLNSLIKGIASTAIVAGGGDVDFSNEDVFRNWLEGGSELQSEDLGGADKYSRWRHTVTSEVIKKKLNQNFDLKVATVLRLDLGQRNKSGSLVDLTVCYEDTVGEIHKFKLDSELNIRNSLHEGCLSSSAFVYAKIVERNGEFISCDIIGV